MPCNDQHGENDGEESEWINVVAVRGEHKQPGANDLSVSTFGRSNGRQMGGVQTPEARTKLRKGRSGAPCGRNKGRKRRRGKAKELHYLPIYQVTWNA